MRTVWSTGMPEHSLSRVRYGRAGKYGGASSSSHAAAAAVDDGAGAEGGDDNDDAAAVEAVVEAAVGVGVA